MDPAPHTLRCAVFGASGGIGAALAKALAARADVAEVHAGSRGGTAPAGAKLRPFAFDLTDEASIAAACAAIPGPLDIVLIASGRLTRADGTGPEKSYRALSAEGMAELFAVNTIGPALTLHPAGQPKQVQVRHGFAQGEGGLVHIEWPFEQHGQELVSTTCLCTAGLEQLGQALGMVRLELRDARGRALKGPPMRGQHQSAIRQLRHLLQ